MKQAPKATCSFWLVVMLLVLVPMISLAQGISGPEDILVRNVTLIDPTGQSEERKVNILIRNHKLEVITEEKISSEEAQQVVNANGGFIVGKLEIGQLPNFMILSSAPR